MLTPVPPHILNKMDVKESICRLCFNNTDGRHKIIDNLVEEIFDILLIQLNLNICGETTICDDCTKTILRCLRFKASCIQKERQILTSTISNAESKPTLTNINNKNNEETIGDVGILCTFCMNVVRSDQSKIDSLTNALFKEMLPIFLPEKRLETRKNYTTCSSCRGELEFYFNFIINHVDIEERINTYIQQNMGMIQNNLTNVQYWLLQNGLKLHNIHQKKSSITKQHEKSETFPCELCPYVGKRKDSIKSHMLKHKDITEVELHKCHICGYKSKWKSSIRNHMKVHDDTIKVKTYKCPHCTYETKYKSDVKRHAVKHMELSEVTMFKCEHCTYETRYITSFRSHQLIHKSVSEVKMHKCLECPYETKYKTSLRSHQLTHDNVVEMIKCPQEGCTFETKRRECLKTHALTHKDASEVVIYKCTTCEYQSKRKSHLTAHLLVHKDVSEVTFYQCTDCSYKSKYKSDLTAHKKTHMDVPPVVYKCEICVFVTKYKSNLKVHMKMHQK